VDKYNAANLEGAMLAIELGHWITFLYVMRDVESDIDLSEAEEFADTGRMAYLSFRDEVHDGDKPPRKVRKARDGWTKVSRRSRKKFLKRYQVPEDLDPFNPMPSFPQVREWVETGELQFAQDAE
jgi:hypothetical protein